MICHFDKRKDFVGKSFIYKFAQLICYDNALEMNSID